MTNDKSKAVRALCLDWGLGRVASGINGKVADARQVGRTLLARYNSIHKSYINTTQKQE